MRHERNCTCEQCRPEASMSDNILMGVLTLAGVGFAMMWGSTIIVAAVVALLVAVIAFRIFAPTIGADRQRHRK
ncbi:hypothetical protein [Sphingomonas sp. SRS2]|uniref:hypothetical protein n=1 Tax=Sphingomonas sp. SRS2 TaxID=133190 RepID=UPI000618487D|nr:hypothetical protein [Sphingomonas sp. SRS2]KKC27511.1 hypothetical protein WP12_02840 [Sphingomonas sp. SRS2]